MLGEFVARASRKLPQPEAKPENELIESDLTPAEHRAPANGGAQPKVGHVAASSISVACLNDKLPALRTHTTPPRIDTGPRPPIPTTMIAQRQVARAAQRVGAQLRAQGQRRFASHETENHFIRERRHVKEHARATTGEDTPQFVVPVVD